MYIYLVLVWAQSRPCAILSFLLSVVSPAPKSPCERRNQTLQSFSLQSHYSRPGQSSRLGKPNHASSERASQSSETPTHPYNSVHLSNSKDLLQKPSRAYSRLPHHSPAAQPFALAQTGRSLSSKQLGISVLAPVLSGPCQPHQNPWEWLPHLSKWPECRERLPVPPSTPSDTAGSGPWRRNAGSWPPSSRVSMNCSTLCSPWQMPTWCRCLVEIPKELVCTFSRL